MAGLGICFDANLRQNAAPKRVASEMQPAAMRRPLPQLPSQVQTMRRAMSHDQLSSHSAAQSLQSPQRRARFADSSPLVLNAHEVQDIALDDADSDADAYESHVDGYETPSERLSLVEEAISPPLQSAPAHKRAQSVDDSQVLQQARQVISHARASTDLGHLHQMRLPSQPIPRQLANLGRRNLGRPQSMMELAHLAALQSISDSSSPTYLETHAIGIHSPEKIATPPSTTLSQISGASGASFASAGEMQLRRAKSTVSMRSAASMRGLEAAEGGGAAIAFDQRNRGFAQGVPFVAADARQMFDRSSVVVASQDPLARQATLLSANGNATKRQREINRILVPSNSKQAGLRSPVILEQAKGKARVELDVALNSSLVVEGGQLAGRLDIRIKPNKDGLLLGHPKVRVVGFEELANAETRHVFYHHSETISSAQGNLLPCYSGPANNDGLRQAVFGHHSIPFSFTLPLQKGAKGSFKSKQGHVRYIVIGSISLQSSIDTVRSIAHFYRQIDLYPYIDSAKALRSERIPLVDSRSKSLFLGGDGKVNVTASIHRATWVAGQLCYVKIDINNQSTKRLRSLNLQLIRTITIFRPRPYLTMGNGIDANDAREIDVDADACQTQTIRKNIAEAAIDAGKKGQAGDVTAKGMWLGVDKESEASFTHSLLLPTDTLSLTRGRHIEVSYHMRVAVGSTLASDIAVEVPITIINFVSLDPPPGHVSQFEVVEVVDKEVVKPVANRMSREVSHRISLDRIGSAIASAAARHGKSPSDAQQPRPQPFGADRQSLHSDDLEWEEEVECVLDNISQPSTVHSAASERSPIPKATLRQFASVDNLRSAQTRGSFGFATPDSPVRARTESEGRAKPLKSALKSPQKASPASRAGSIPAVPRAHNYLSPPLASPNASSPASSDLSTPPGSVIIHRSPRLALSPSSNGLAYDWSGSQPLRSPRLSKMQSVPNISAVTKTHPASLRAKVLVAGMELDSQRSSRATLGSPASDTTFRSPSKILTDYSLNGSFHAPMLR